LRFLRRFAPRDTQRARCDGYFVIANPRCFVSTSLEIRKGGVAISFLLLGIRTRRDRHGRKLPRNTQRARCDRCFVIGSPARLSIQVRSGMVGLALVPQLP